MKRERIHEDLPWGKGDHPDAAKPLTAFRQITAVCGDCGHSKTLDEHGLASLSAVPSFAALARHASCWACREAGATSPANLSFYPELREPPRTVAPPVRWSEKPVFTEDRSDPTPNLPRRSVFGGSTSHDGV